MPRVSSVRQNVRGWPSPQKAATGSSRNLAPRNDSRPENRCVWIVAADQPLDSQVAILSAGNDHRGSSGQRCKWLTKPAQREHTAAQRIQRVDQHDVPIALQTKMLESVVEQEDVRMQFSLHAAADFVAIGADPHMRGSLPHVGLRLIAGLLDWRTFRRAERSHPAAICGRIPASGWPGSGPLRPASALNAPRTATSPPRPWRARRR